MLEKEGGGGGSGKMRAIGVNSSSGDIPHGQFPPDLVAQLVEQRLRVPVSKGFRPTVISPPGVKSLGISPPGAKSQGISPFLRAPL